MSSDDLSMHAQYAAGPFSVAARTSLLTHPTADHCLGRVPIGACVPFKDVRISSPLGPEIHGLDLHEVDGR